MEKSSERDPCHQKIKQLFGNCYQTCVVYTKTIIRLSVGEWQWIFTSPKRLGKYPPLFTSTLANNCLLFTSWRFPEKKMAREPHFGVKYSSCLGTAIKLVLYILKQLFASVSVNSGGYLPRRSGSVNIHRYSPPLQRIIVNCQLLYTMHKFTVGESHTQLSRYMSTVRLSL